MGRVHQQCELAVRLLANRHCGVGLDAEHTASSRAVLARQGNVSSGTVLCVLDHLRKLPGVANKLAVSLSFGPGLCIEGCVLRVCPQ